MTAAFILVSGTIQAGAQQSPTTPQTQQQQPAEGGMMGRGMKGGGMMREGMMGRGTMSRGMMGPMMSPLAMRMIFALMDSDGDGTVSLQEFQTAHERIFKAMDANKDGVLTLEEILSFMRGTSVPAQQPSNPPTPQRQ
jgi:hypothetical protein